MSVNEKMTAIADAIRDKTGETEPLSLDEIAEKIPNVYKAGQDSQADIIHELEKENAIIQSNMNTLITQNNVYYNEERETITEIQKICVEVENVEIASGLHPNISDAIPEVYDAGKKSQYDEFWDIFQEKGNRANYEHEFRYRFWNERSFKPKYDIKPTYSIQNMFRNFNDSSDNTPIDMVELTERLGITIDISKASNKVYAFASAKVIRWGTIDLTGGGETNYAFYGGYGYTGLKTIEKLIVNENTGYGPGLFNYCNHLEKIIFEGVIANNGLNLQSSSKLSHESLMSIINCLKDYSEDTSGTVWKVTVGSTNLAKLTDEEKEIAEKKGWVLA